MLKTIKKPGETHSSGLMFSDPDFTKQGLKYGAGTKSRTRDLLITSQLLYQLSYAGNYSVSGIFLPASQTVRRILEIKRKQIKPNPLAHTAYFSLRCFIYNFVQLSKFLNTHF